MAAAADSKAKDTTDEGLPPPDAQDPAPDAGGLPAPDAGASPAPGGSHGNTSLDAGDDGNDDPSQGVPLQDSDPIDLHRQWVSAGLGYVRNTPNGTGSSYFTAAGFRYGYDIARMIFMDSGKTEDSLTAEGAVYFYNILNLDQANDSYNLMPVTLTMRYNMFFTESVGVFLYGGVVKNVIFSANPAGSPTTATRVSNMSLLMPAAGAGLLFQMGPGWYTRIDAGIDIAGLSLVLRF